MASSHSWVRHLSFAWTCLYQCPLSGNVCNLHFGFCPRLACLPAGASLATPLPGCVGLIPCPCASCRGAAC